MAPCSWRTVACLAALAAAWWIPRFGTRNEPGLLPGAALDRLAQRRPKETLSVHIDCDPSLDHGRDVDDVLALLYLCDGAVRQQHNLRVTGVSVVFGNVGVGDACDAARTILDRVECGGPALYCGASRPQHNATAAVHALVNHSGVVLAIGPATNVAAALAYAVDHGIRLRWTRVVALGGTQRAGPNVRYLRMTELNWYLDVGAAAGLLHHTARLGIPLVVVPMEPCRQVLFRHRETTRVPDWVGADVWLSLGPFLWGYRGFHPWDVLAAVFLTHPHCFERALARVRLSRRPLHSGHLELTPLLPGEACETSTTQAAGGGCAQVITSANETAILSAWHRHLDRQEHAGFSPGK